jgi:hypothetical protein
MRAHRPPPRQPTRDQAGAAVDLTDLPTLIATMSGGITVILSVVMYLVGRTSRQNRHLRDVRETSIVQARRLYAIEHLAARRGWDQDPDWPQTPRELTPEYLAGRAEASHSSELQTLIHHLTGGAK